MKIDSFKTFLTEGSYGTIQGVVTPEISNYILSLHKAIPENMQYLDEDNEAYGIESGFQVRDQHVTIFYGLGSKYFSQPLKNELMELVKNEVPITFDIDGISYFEREDFSVAYLSVKSTILTSLNKKVSEVVTDYESKFSGYSAHITIAYLQPHSRLPDKGKKFTDQEFKRIEMVSPSDIKTTIAGT